MSDRPPLRAALRLIRHIRRAFLADCWTAHRVLIFGPTQGRVRVRGNATLSNLDGPLLLLSTYIAEDLWAAFIAFTATC